jgi:hypothetical protein
MVGSIINRTNIEKPLTRDQYKNTEVVGGPICGYTFTFGWANPITGISTPPIFISRYQHSNQREIKHMHRLALGWVSEWMTVVYRHVRNASPISWRLEGDVRLVVDKHT